MTLREVGDAFAHASAIAAEEGAGTLVHVGRFDLAEFAVVLEPDEPLRTARRAFYAGMAALADALAVHAPPEKPIALRLAGCDPVDGGLVGGGRLAWPAGAAEDEPPAWLVFGAMIRTVAMGEEEPGLRPLAIGARGGRLRRSRLRPAGRELRAPSHGGDRSSGRSSGFGAVAQDLSGAARARSRGVRRDIDENGDLLVRRMAHARSPSGARSSSALATPSWLDPATGGPAA